MSELEVIKEITYTISRLTLEDMELLCLGLERMDDCEFDLVDRKAELIEAIESVLPTNNGDTQ